MFNIERPLPVGLFQTVQAFAVNCHNLLQCSLHFSLQTTYPYPQSHRGSCVRMSPLMHQPSSQRTTKSVEFPMGSATWVNVSTSSPFLDVPIETRRQSIKYYKCHRYPQMISIFWCHLPSAKCANLKDLGSVVKEGFHDVLSVQWSINPPGSLICCFHRTLVFAFLGVVTSLFTGCSIPTPIPKFQFSWLIWCLQIFFSMPKMPSTIQLVLQHPGD